MYQLIVIVDSVEACATFSLSFLNRLMAVQIAYHLFAYSSLQIHFHLYFWRNIAGTEEKPRPASNVAYNRAHRDARNPMKAQTSKHHWCVDVLTCVRI